MLKSFITYNEMMIEQHNIEKNIHGVMLNLYYQRKYVILSEILQDD